MPFDLIIIGGRVIDGTGSPPFSASVGIRGDRIEVLRQQLTEEASDQIDASGLVVSPGFIDLHSHSGLMLLAEPAHEAKVRQGVTTEVIGVDGLSYAPIMDVEKLAELVRFNAGLDGRPDLDYSWNSVMEYLRLFDGSTTTNVAMLIGNSAVRLSAIGWNDEPASENDLRNMESLLREGFEEGAFGLSTGLDYPPGSYAPTDELVRLSRVVAEHGGIYHTHVRYQLGDRFKDPFREAIDIGRQSGAPVHITHFYRRATAPGGSSELLGLIDDAVDDGIEITFDTYPYAWSSTKLLMLIPMHMQSGGPEILLDRLADQVTRADVRKAINERAEHYGGQHVWNRIHLGYFSDPVNQEYEGRTIAEIASSRHQHPADAICDLLISEDLRVNQVSAGPDPVSMASFVVHRLSMIGSDSVFLGERPSPRTYGTFPRVLGQFVRDERIVGLPEAIRKMTSYPAQTLGMHDRGLLRTGMKADVVVFDPQKINGRATYENPRVYSEGVVHVVVNGSPVLRDAKMTGNLPGAALRS